MRTIFAAVILAFFWTPLLTSCGGSVENGNAVRATDTPAPANANMAKSNVEELSLFVRVPYEAEDIVWKQDPSNRHIVAVLRFSPKDAAELVAEAEKSGPSRSVSLPVESWYPEELVAQGEVSGDSTLKATAYSASPFFQEPFNTGRVSRIEGSDFFILEVSPR